MPCRNTELEFLDAPGFIPVGFGRRFTKVPLAAYLSDTLRHSCCAKHGFGVRCRIARSSRSCCACAAYSARRQAEFHAAQSGVSTEISQSCQHVDRQQTGYDLVTRLGKDLAAVHHRFRFQVLSCQLWKENPHMIEKTATSMQREKTVCWGGCERSRRVSLTRSGVKLNASMASISRKPSGCGQWHLPIPVLEAAARPPVCLER